MPSRVGGMHKQHRACALKSITSWSLELEIYHTMEIF